MQTSHLQQHTPILLTQQTDALSIQGMLIAGNPLIPLEAMEYYGVLQSRDRISCERITFGMRLPYLPILLNDGGLIGQDDKERVAEILDQQARLLTNLAKWKDTAFSLRYLLDPHFGRVEIALLGRVLAKPGRGREVAGAITSDAVSQLNAQQLTPEIITTERELLRFLMPVSNPNIVEIWQKQHVVQLTFERSFGLEEESAVVVCPFRRPAAATWLQLFKALTAQRSPVFINIHIEPTVLFQFEADRLAQNARRAESASRYTLKRNTYETQLTDPVAITIARIYGDTWQRLTKGRPVVMTVQVGSPDQVAAYSLAQVLAVELTEEHPFDSEGQDSSQLPSGFEIVTPEDDSDVRAALRTLTELDLHPWQASGTEYMGRLIYLTDARTAAAAFRFPVALRGGIPGIETRNLAPDYFVGLGGSDTSEGGLLVGTLINQSREAFIPRDHLTRHGLVAGTNGSGKTTTCMHLLAQLWSQGIPFLIIEPAKKEYRALLDSAVGEDLQVFTLGDESVSPFRMNPLEIQLGVMVESHLSQMRFCLESAIPSFGALPSLIEESLLNAYMAKQWELVDRGQANDERQMPTLAEVYFEIIQAVEKRGYSDKTLQDIRGAAAGRLSSLLRGSKGRMLNTRWSIPIEKIMKRPTVLELDALTDDDKALVMLFLLTAIREYCVANRVDDRLRHVVLIEEAHRVMSKTPHVADRETSADTRAQAVSMVSAALSELRGFGEGIIIAEQIPSRLAEDALKNTNFKIVHKLPGDDDRNTIGGTINASTEQKSYIAQLPPGQAALFMEGYTQPAFVIIPNFKADHQLANRVPDERVQTHMRSWLQKEGVSSLPFSGCQYCHSICRHRDRVGEIAYQVNSRHRFFDILWKFERLRRAGNEAAGWQAVAEASMEAIQYLPRADEDAAYCYFVHLWEHKMTEATAHKLRQAFREL